MEWGKLKENVIRFNSKGSGCRFMLFGHDSLYIRIWTFELRIMKPWVK